VAPTELFSPLFGLDIAASRQATLDLTLNPDFEYALLPLTGSARVDGESIPADEFAYLGQGRDRLSLEVAAESKILLLGGEAFAEPVLMWWNFIGFDKARIAQAQAHWEAGDARFGPVPGQRTRLSAPPLPWSGV